MAKFCGMIGYVMPEEIEPGLWEEQPVERLYYGDVLRHSFRSKNSGGVNDDIDISNQISVVTDPFANENFYAMRYIVYRGVKWKIENVEVQYPRLLLTLGGVYNGQTTPTSS